MSLPLASMVQSVTSLAFNLAGEIVVSGIYTQRSDFAYDPATGVVPPGDVIATVSAIVGSYIQKETDGQRIRAGDEKLLVKASELPVIVPNVDDVFNTLGTEKVPTGQTYGAGYVLTGLTAGALYYFVPDTNGGSEVQTADGLTEIKTVEGFFVAPATSVLLVGESSDTVSASIKPISLQRQVVSIDLDPTGTLYTFQTRKAQQ